MFGKELEIKKLTKSWYILVSPKPATTEPMRLILIILVFVSSLLLASTTASAGISTKKQDILKLIGTTDAPNGKFAWIELNGEDYGWTREGERIDDYVIVSVEMGKIKLKLNGRVVKLILLPENAQSVN